MGRLRRLAPALAALAWAPLLSGAAGLSSCAEAPTDDQYVVAPSPGASFKAGGSSAPTVDGHFEAADRFLDQGNPAEAILELQETARRLDPNDPRMVRYHERMGGIYLAENNIPAAKDSYGAAIKLARDLVLQDELVADVHVGMALCLLKEGNRTYAVRFLRKALTLAPSEGTRKLAEDELRKNSGTSKP